MRWVELDFPEILQSVWTLCENPESTDETLWPFLIQEDVLKALEEKVYFLHAYYSRGEPLPSTRSAACSAYWDEVLEGENYYLSEEALASIAVWLALTGSLERFAQRSLFETRNVIPPSWKCWVEGLDDLSELRKLFASYITPLGSWKWDELPFFKAAQRRRQNLREQLHQRTQDIVRRYPQLHIEKELIERDQRFLLALSASSKGNIPLVVHDSSAKGAILYAEPMEFLELNNQLRRLALELEEQRRKILQTLSQACLQYKRELKSFYQSFLLFDTWKARALWSYQHGYVFLVSKEEEKNLSLYGVRHPLLQERAVPFDLCLNSQQRLFLVTGPNAGGKTLTLKTIALCVLLHQHGLGLPVDEKSSLPLFDDVFCLLGDQQSLSQGLSSFSGQLKKITQILSSASVRSLVFFDELASGTNALEGGILARVVCESLLDQGVLTLVSTHETSLQQWALEEPQRILVASMDFDEEHWVPRYQLRLGVLGRSYALVLAKSMGFPQRFLDRCQELYQALASETQKELHSLSQAQHRLEEEKETFEQEKKIFFLQEEHWQREREKKEQLYLQRLENLISQEGLLLRQGRQELEKLLQTRAYFKEDWKEKKKHWQEQHQQSLEEHQGELKELKKTSKITIAQAKEGDEVRIRSTGQRASLLRKQAGGWCVLVGSLQWVFPFEDLELLDVAKERTLSEKRVDFSIDKTNLSYWSSTLDIRGLRLEEALKRVKEHLSQALILNYDKLSVIHGTGEGILQKGLWKLLAKESYVKGFSFAHPQDGGFGKTLVDLSST